MAVEKELKLALGDADVAKAIAFLETESGAAGETFTLGNVYFDTPELDLAAARVALRVRRTPAGWLQTLKTAGQASNGLHARGEWELPVAGDALDLPALLEACDDAEAKAPLQALATRLSPVFRTDFDRTTWLVRTDGAQIEAALDLGAVHLGSAAWQASAQPATGIETDEDDAGADRAGSAAVDSNRSRDHVPIREIELELKSGTEHALLAFAERLRAAVTGLSADNVSKAARGYRLAREAAAAKTNASVTSSSASSLPSVSSGISGSSGSST